MSSDKLLDFLSRRRLTVPSIPSSTNSNRLRWATYSAQSKSENETTLYAATNSYLDDLFEADECEVDQILFRTNVAELERETFKLEQEIDFLELTERRLSKEYVDNFVFKALKAGRVVAAKNVSSALRELELFNAMFEDGAVTRIDVAAAEERVENAKILLAKADIDLLQRTIEIESQQRHLTAQRDDLVDRIKLNEQITTAYQFKAPWPGKIIRHSFKGAFVEEGDPILTLKPR
ncbi:hypothetical protein HFO39_14160 [Rhizobium leguminosarum]|uniref:TolC family protein n=1 Tax=Rhizobium leguminosarum TaxID=384 RepID=UPI001C972F4B|nr:TolC family protein [Rhizobium leguminosarum]MBY5635913.1 hypothetical protein [Rhizobium leguminosarum]